MATIRSGSNIGCAACWQAEPSAVYAAFQSFDLDASLIDEPHHIVSIRRCPKCSQKYLSIFTETVDYLDGEDPQYRVILPLTNAEARRLDRLGDTVTEQDLTSIGVRRTSLRIDHPKGAPFALYWGTGVQIRDHD